MNSFPGIIQNISKSEDIMLVDLLVNGHPMSALLTENPYTDSWLVVGNSVSVVFKETEVSLMKNFSGKISLRNQLPCKVLKIEKGAIIGCVHLAFDAYKLISVITSRSIDFMEIQSGDDITAMIKANEVSIIKA